MVAISVVAMTLLVFLRSFSEARNVTLDGAWREWKDAHGRVYGPGEEGYRRSIWEWNLQVIQQHNWEASQGLHTFQLNMNQFGDLSNDEYRRLVNGARPELDVNRRVNNVFRRSATFQPPAYVNWRARGYVTPVKNQGACGSCWAFSSTGALEGLHFKRTGNLISLSEQNLMDCSTYLGNNGCNGGWMPLAFEYVAQNDGIDSERSYPYQAQSGFPCRYSPWNRAATCDSLVMVQSGSEEALEEAVATTGPVSVAVDASSIHFQFYSSGIFYLESCGNTLDHGMLVVGYGVSQWNGQDYWLLKNSWGTEWGEEGYMQVAKGANNMCGVASAASFPIM
ncbi:procathepsin L-like [Eublepharis macularius]|uniref:Procathepsin L-like n=1 Tax=Eublepharis macularius TaxID=481883 RepID=A0AA97JFR5_EUBMA|nr:procathepsin L-like [Eublepharis macularius]